MATFTLASYEDYSFPVWADALGWLVGITTLVPLPVCAIYVIWKRQYVSMNFTCKRYQELQFFPRISTSISEQCFSKSTFNPSYDIEKVHYVVLACKVPNNQNAISTPASLVYYPR